MAEVKNPDIDDIINDPLGLMKFNDLKKKYGKASPHFFTTSEGETEAPSYSLSIGPGNSKSSNTES